MAQASMRTKAADDPRTQKLTDLLFDSAGQYAINGWYAVYAILLLRHPGATE